MAFGAHTWPDITQVAEPTSRFTPDLAISSSTPLFNPYGMPVYFVELPDIKGFVAADGWLAPRVMIEGKSLRLGILPPDTDDMTVTPTGARAASTLTLSGQPNNDDRIIVGGNGGMIIYFKTALVTWDGTGSPPSGYGNQVLIGSTLAETIDNLYALVNDEPGHDSTYVNSLIDLGLAVTSIAAFYYFNASAETATTITFRAVDYGTAGNAYNSNTVLDNAGVQSWSASPTMSGGSAGTGDYPLAGTRVWAYRYFRSWDGAFSGIGNRIEATTGIPMSVDLANMVDHPDDSDVTHKEWLRSLVKSGLYYRGEMIKDGTTTDNDDKSDVEIGAGEPYNDGLFRPFEFGNVPNYAYPEIHLGSLFMAGGHRLADYDRGTITVANGSRVVTFTGTAVISPMAVGGILEVDGDGDEYILVRYDDATGAGVLNRAFEGAGGSGKTFSLRSYIDPDELAWSVPRKWNQFPVSNVSRGAASNSYRGITGLKSHWDSLQVFTQDSIYRLSGTSTFNFQLRKVVEGVGTVSHGSIVEAEGILYFVGLGVIYAWSGGEAALPLTKPPLVEPGDAPGIHETMKRVNFRVPEMITGYFDVRNRKILWSVPLDNEVYPTHTIVFDLQTQGWAVDDGVRVVSRANLIDDGGTPIEVGGGLFGDVYEMDYGEADAAYPASPVRSITAIDEDLQQITVDGTTLDNNEVRGGRMLCKSSDGEYINLSIVSNTGNVIVYAEPIPASITIAVDDQVAFGGIYGLMRTGEFTNGATARYGRVTDFDAFFNPQDLDGRLYLGCGGDGDDPALPDTLFSELSADLTDSSGHIRTRQNVRGRRHQVEARVPLPGGQPEIIELGVAYRTGVERKGMR